MFLADRFIVGTCPQKDCQAEGAKGDQCDKCGKLLEDPMDLVNPQCYICHQTPVVR
jgi:methionyl-tRNA synthetase